MVHIHMVNRGRQSCISLYFVRPVKLKAVTTTAELHCLICMLLFEKILKVSFKLMQRSESFVLSLCCDLIGSSC